MMGHSLSSIEVCAGAGGQALGMEQAGLRHEALVDIDHHCCATLQLNRPDWKVYEKALQNFVETDAQAFKGISLVAGGLPCPPFSIAGKQLGEEDERNLFPTMLQLVDIVRPRAVMIENVRGFLGAVFEDYRRQLKTQFKRLGYRADWKLLNASDFGVPQLRPRVVIVALKKEIASEFSWPTGTGTNPPTVGEALYKYMAQRGWKGAAAWKKRADDIGPTIVGGSFKHGGPDLGPTRAKRAWATLGVDGMGIADDAPSPDFVGMPRLTVRMAARLQGFPDDWEFAGRKTPAYRQVGNAFPPPVARAVAEKICECLGARQLAPVVEATG